MEPNRTGTFSNNKNHYQEHVEYYPKTNTFIFMCNVMSYDCLNVPCVC